MDISGWLKKKRKNEIKCVGLGSWAEKKKENKEERAGLAVAVKCVGK